LGFGELFGDRVALSGVDGLAVEVGAVELPKVQARGVVVDWSPADRRDALQAAVDEHGFGVGVVEAMVVGQASEYRAQRNASGRGCRR